MGDSIRSENLKMEEERGVSSSISDLPLAGPKSDGYAGTVPLLGEGLYHTLGYRSAARVEYFLSIIEESILVFPPPPVIGLTNTSS